MYIAHVRELDKEIQTIKTHLLGVQRLAEQFGEKLGLKHVAGLAGLLHDLGKYSEKFQQYIDIVAFHPELPQPKRGELIILQLEVGCYFHYFTIKKVPSAKSFWLKSSAMPSSLITPTSKTISHLRSNPIT